MNTKRLFFCFVMACTAALSGCGGGGGSGGNMGPGPVRPVDQCIRTSDFGCISSSRYSQEVERLRQIHGDSTDFSNQWGLGAINADRAYAHLELAEGANMTPGQGVTVGLIDTGIDTGHFLFAEDRISEEVLDGAFDELGDKPSHGTAVASVIGAQPTGRANGFHGVAWGADLKMFAISLEDPPLPGTIYRPPALGSSGGDAADARLYRHVLGQDLDILNLSFTTSGLIENYDADVISSSFGQTIAALAQTGVEDKTILVWAAGNANNRACTPGTINCDGSDRRDIEGNLAGSLNANSPEIFAGMMARIEELQGHSIAVAAVDRNGDIAKFSNRCGIAAEWCIAAPGVDVWVAYFGPDTQGNIGRRGIRGPLPNEPLDGTSYAAPMVSGSLAVMKQLFRGQLSNTALVTRLFDTADKSDRYANRATYGQGMLDLGAATSPVRTTSIALGNTVGSSGINIQSTSLRLGGALGDGLGQALAGQEIAAFDSLGAPFWFKLSNFTGTTRGPSSLVRLRELTAQSPITRRTAGRLATFTPARAGGSIEQDLGYGMLRFGYRERPAGPEGGHFMLADNATTLTFTGSNGMSFSTFTAPGFAGRSPTSGVALAWRPFDVPVGFRAGWLAEQATLLGTMATGAFGQLSADAAVTGLETSFEIGRWHLAADAEIGKAHPQIRGGIITRMSSLTTSAFAFNATRRLANGGLIRIALSQPLRVEGGRAALSVPIGRTKDGAVLRQAVSADVAPSGRQIDVSAQWYYPLVNGELRFDAAWMHNPGHNANADPAVRLLAGWRFEF
ncbi:MAG: S8 family serine peptidase [Nitrospira sp. SB0672_bin_25]|nr:S8 family serine peptidase [Nitrospira sp. SB0666_bin_27]MYF25427.1 S8 family serine peptidase [Nitrospira sp. SB0678_bin_10]MYJ54445.1 S8 family serine peptidase [Nitrospira sp. SB0672_bin_25]